MGITKAYQIRRPPPQHVIEKTLFMIGGWMRAAGEALDSFGAGVQGKAGSLPQQPVPSYSVAPFPVQDGPGGIVKSMSRELHAFLLSHNSRLPADAPKDAKKLERFINERLDKERASFDPSVLPRKDASTFIAPNAQVIGNVTLGKGSSVWYGAVLRGDVNAIEVGDMTNIQDNAVVHSARHNAAKQPMKTVIGSNTTIGHGAVVHAATVGDNCLVGMGATLLDGVVMENGSMVAAGALVPPNTVVPAGKVFGGNPAKLLRAMEPHEGPFITESAKNYAELAQVGRKEREGRRGDGKGAGGQRGGRGGVHVLLGARRHAPHCSLVMTCWTSPLDWLGHLIGPPATRARWGLPARVVISFLFTTGNRQLRA